MGQITIYLDNETEQKLNAVIGNTKISKSKWIADLIRTKTETTWPETITKLAGSWKDLPEADIIRKQMGQDTPREPL
jgi:hypothetical protein